VTRRSERLRRILRVREVQEEQARAAWLRTENVARDAEAGTERLREALADMTARLSSELAALPPTWVVLSHDQIDRTGQRVVDQRERARTLRNQADAARVPWTQRRAAARGLERLVDRTCGQERADELAADAQAMDELNMARAAMRRSRGVNDEQ